MMTRIILIADSLPSLAAELRRTHDDVQLFTADDFCASPAADEAELSYIYFPAVAGDGMLINLERARQVFQRTAPGGQFVLLSSALVYGIGPGRQPLVTEDYSLPGCESQKVCEQWRSLESLAA